MNVDIGPAIIIALLCGAAVGAINAFFILYFGVHSLIVTLGTGYFINGLILWISNSATIAGVSMGLVKAVILTRVFGIPIAFYYALDRSRSSSGTCSSTRAWDGDCCSWGGAGKWRGFPASTSTGCAPVR